MTITFYPELSLFLQSINNQAGTLTVTFCPPNSTHKSIEILLEPEVKCLQPVDTVLHQSPTKAYDMGNKINGWFSDCFGYDVMLVYLGPHLRPVLNTQHSVTGNGNSQHWFSNMASVLPGAFGAKPKEDDDGITFADVASYLVVTEESLDDVSSRLPDGMQMDITKFRPNIVVSGSQEAWDEDYWGGLTIGETPDDSVNSRGNVQMTLTMNCARCVSINIDYSTGQTAQGAEGEILKKLMKDRRVDKGAKYSPIFGRYGFLNQASSSEYPIISVGDQVIVSKRNAERTTFGGYIVSIN